MGVWRHSSARRGGPATRLTDTTGASGAPTASSTDHSRVACAASPSVSFVNGSGDDSSTTVPSPHGSALANSHARSVSSTAHHAGPSRGPLAGASRGPRASAKSRPATSSSTIQPLPDRAAWTW
jgi:hypothetical protein